MLTVGLVFAPTPIAMELSACAFELLPIAIDSDPVALPPPCATCAACTAFEVDNKTKSNAEIFATPVTEERTLESLELFFL